MNVIQKNVLRLPKSSILEHCLFTFLLVATLATGQWLWIARIAWVILPLLFFVNFHYALYAIFFFAAFFHPTGFLPEIFMSLKHFHIALALAALVQVIRGSFVRTLQTGIQRGFAFYPILGIILITLTVSTVRQAPTSEILTSLNLLSIMGAFFYLFGLVKGHEQLIQKCALFFAAGVSVEVFVALYNFAADSFIFSLQETPHNNHLGLWAGFAFFYPLAYAAGESSIKNRAIGWSLACILFFGMFFSCSRTAWFSFIFGALLFLVHFIKLPPAGFKRKFFSDFIRVAFVFSIFLVVSVATKFQQVYYYLYWRFHEIPRLWDGWFWKYTLQDQQNFGFFGIHRLNQLHETKAILETSPFFGVGFVLHVVDFHSLYLALLGASGLVGLGMFIYFSIALLAPLHRAIINPGNLSTRLIQMASFSAVSAWLLMAIMENLILQYPIWMNVFFAAFMTQLPKNSSPCNQN